MSDLGEIREMIRSELSGFVESNKVEHADIKSYLASYRAEHREDVKDLHDKIDRKHCAITNQVKTVSDDAIGNKSNIKMFAGLLSFFISGFTAWIVTKLNGSW